MRTSDRSKRNACAILAIAIPFACVVLLYLSLRQGVGKPFEPDVTRAVQGFYHQYSRWPSSKDDLVKGMVQHKAKSFHERMSYQKLTIVITPSSDGTRCFVDVIYPTIYFKSRRLEVYPSDRETGEMLAKEYLGQTNE